MRLGVQTLAALALTGSLAAVASADVSRKASRAAGAAAERVERDMRRNGALESSVRGCWRTGPAVDCAAMVKGDDGHVRWRCYIQIRVQRRGSRLRSKLTDALCVAVDVSRADPEDVAGRER
jgi:hypothetical protein